MFKAVCGISVLYAKSILHFNSRKRFSLAFSSVWSWPYSCLFMDGNYTNSSLEVAGHAACYIFVLFVRFFFSVLC